MKKDGITDSNVVHADEQLKREGTKSLSTTEEVNFTSKLGPS